MAISPLMMLSQGQAGAINAGAPPAQEPTFWQNFMSGGNELMNDPMRMALLMGGLGLMSGQNVAQAAGSGVNIYQQLTAQQKADAEQARQAEMDTKKIALDERQVEQGDERIAVSREEIASREKIAAMNAKARAANATPPKKGIDPKIWAQAYKTVEASSPVGEDGLTRMVDTSAVYEMYNTLSGDAPVYPTFGRGELTAVMEKALDNPDIFDAYYDATVRSWGPRAGARLKAVWDKANAESGEDGKEGGKDDEVKTESSLSDDLVQSAKNLVTPSYWGNQFSNLADAINSNLIQQTPSNGLYQGLKK